MFVVCSYLVSSCVDIDALCLLSSASFWLPCHPIPLLAIIYPLCSPLHFSILILHFILLLLFLFSDSSSKGIGYSITSCLAVVCGCAVCAQIFALHAFLSSSSSCSSSSLDLLSDYNMLLPIGTLPSLLFDESVLFLPPAMIRNHLPHNNPSALSSVSAKRQATSSDSIFPSSHDYYGAIKVSLASSKAKEGEERGEERVEWRKEEEGGRLL